MTRYIARGKDVAARTIGDELMIMSGRDSSLFSLNETAAALWDAADGQTSLESIVDNEICERFDVSREEALADAEALAEELARHCILEISDSPIPR